jgi:hypothetical protein
MHAVRPVFLFLPVLVTTSIYSEELLGCAVFSLQPVSEGVRQCTYTFRKVRRGTNFAQVGIHHTYGQLYTYVQNSPAEVQTPKHWNVIDHSMSAWQPVIAQQYPPATSQSLRFNPRKEKFGAHLNMLHLTFNFYILFFKFHYA